MSGAARSPADRLFDYVPSSGIKVPGSAGGNSNAGNPNADTSGSVTPSVTTEPMTIEPTTTQPRTTIPRSSEPTFTNPFDTVRPNSPAGERVPTTRSTLEDPVVPAPVAPSPAPSTRTPNSIQPNSIPAADDPFALPKGTQNEAPRSVEPTPITTGRPILPTENNVVPDVKPELPETKPVFDDPFAPQSTSSPNTDNKSNIGPALEAPTKKPLPAASDDPFAEPAPSTTQLEPMDAMRTWVDVTGKHRIRGQLQEILAEQGKVRILKETGRFTTVPLEKLGPDDRQFVAGHTTARGGESAKLAASSSR